MRARCGGWSRHLLLFSEPRPARQQSVLVWTRQRACRRRRAARQRPQPRRVRPRRLRLSRARWAHGHGHAHRDYNWQPGVHPALRRDLWPGRAWLALRGALEDASIVRYMRAGIAVHASVPFFFLALSLIQLAGRSSHWQQSHRQWQSYRRKQAKPCTVCSWHALWGASFGACVAIMQLQVVCQSHFFQPWHPSLAASVSPRDRFVISGESALCGSCQQAGRLVASSRVFEKPLCRH